MATDVARLVVVVEADTAKAEQGIQSLHQQLSGLGALFGQGAATGAGFGIALAGVNAAIGALQGAFSAVSGSAIGLNNQLAQSQIAFTTMLGSAEQAGAFLRQLQQFAAATPFEFPELVQSSQRMLAMGFAARDVVPLLTSVGNAAAALGSGSAGVDRITLALGQMQAKTRVSGDEMLQLTESGIPAWRILAEAIGQSVPATQKLAEQGQITSDVFVRAFKTFSDQNWGGMMEKQSHTFEGAMSTIRDSLQNATATAFRPFFDALTVGADKLAQFLSSDTFSSWAAAASGAVQSVVTALAPIGTVLERAFAQLTAGDAGGALATVSQAVGQAMTAAVETINSFGQAMFGAGWTLMTTLAGGIVQGANQAIQAAINVVADMIASFFVGSSPPPAGPLSEIDKAGQTLMETYGEGMKAGLGPVTAAAEAVNAQFTRSDLTGALEAATKQFDAAAGHLDRMKAAGVDVETAIKSIDREVRSLDHDAGAVRYTVDTIKSAFEDQIRPLERQLTLLRGIHDFGRDEKAIAFEERDIALRRQEIGARGNKQAEEAARKAREQFQVEKELYDLGNRQKDLAEKRAEIPLLQQIEQLKHASEDATGPLTDQLRVLERQKAELTFQKGQWADLKATIADAVAAATPKGGGGGGGGGGAGLKLPAGGAGGALNLGGAIEKGVDDLKAKFLKKGDELAATLTTGITTFFREKAPALIGGAAGALIGGVVLGPVGFALGGLVGARFGEGLTAALRERGVDWDRVMATLREGAERASTLIRSLFSGETLATAVNKAFGDLIPADFNAKLDAIDLAFKNLKTTIQDVAAGVGTAGAAGGFAALADAIDRAGAPQTAGALRDALAQVHDAATNAADIAGGLVDGLGKLAAALGVGQGQATTWGQVVDAVFAGVVAQVTAPIKAFNDLVTAAKAMQAAGEAVATAVGGAWGKASTSVQGALTDMSGAISTWAGDAQRTIDGWITDAGAKIGQWRDDAVAAFEAMKTGAGAKLDEAATAVGDFVDGVVASIKGLIGSAGAEAAKVGNAIVDGLVGPILGRVQEIVNAAAALGRAAIKAVTDVIKPGSPSKVFIEIGVSIVDGLRVGITSSLDSLPSAFQRMTQLFRDAAQSLKGPIDDLIGRFYQGVTAMGKDVSTGYFADFLRHNNIETARHLADALRGYLDEYLDKLGTLADDAVPAVRRVQEDLANGLADAVAQATKSAADAVEQAAAQIQDAISSLAESRDLRRRRATFGAGQSAAAQARRDAREDTEAQYQLQQDLAKATSDAERQQVMARYAEAETARQHRRQLEAEDRAFAAQQAAEAQAFEDQLADEALAKQLARIGQERDARLRAVQDELAAREAGLVTTARTALTRIVQDLNDQLNKSLGAFFDNLPEEMRKRGGPTDPGFLGAVRNDVAGLLVPIVGMIQSLFANLVGIGNDYGPGVPLPALPPGGAFSLPALPSATPAPAPPVVINVAGSVWSLSELASVLKPELARVVTT